MIASRVNKTQKQNDFEVNKIVDNLRKKHEES